MDEVLPVGVMSPLEVAPVLDADPPLEVGSPVSVVPHLELLGRGLGEGAVRDLSRLLELEARCVEGARCVHSSC